MPVFKRHHFDKIIDLASKGRIAPLYLFLGNAEIGRELSRRLFRFLVGQGFWAEEIDLKEKGLEALKAALLSPSLLGRKVVLLRLESPLPAPESEKIAGILGAHKQRLTLISALEELAETDPLALFAREAGVLMRLPARKGTDFLRYEIPEILAEFGKKMDRETAEELLSRVGDDLGALRQEIEKLVLFVGERPVIYVEDVREVVSPRVEAAPYSVLEALFHHGPEEAFRLTQELITQGVYPLVLVSTFLTFFKRLWVFTELLEKVPDLLHLDYPRFRQKLEQAKKELWSNHPPKVIHKTHPYALFRMLKVVRQFEKEDFRQVFRYLKGLDEALKTGALPSEAFYAFFWGLKELFWRRNSCKA